MKYKSLKNLVIYFQTKDPTVIAYDGHEYIFEGFSIFSHYKLFNVPVCKVLRFYIEYTIHLVEEPMPQVSAVRLKVCILGLVD